MTGRPRKAWEELSPETRARYRRAGIGSCSVRSSATPRKVPKTIRENLRSYEFIEVAVACDHRNWTRSLGDCSRLTHWRCGECGRPVCATHAHWHEKPLTVRWGRLICQSISTRVHYSETAGKFIRA